jgi:predicted porin
MNKSLTLLGLASVAAAAHAQSNVSITGTMDLYVQKATGSIRDNTQLLSGGNSTSKLFIRGTEDLGGGLKAGFWLETAIAANTGAGTATNTNNQPSGATAAGGFNWNRRAIVTLGGNFGEFRLGRDWSPTYDAFTSRFDVFGVGAGIGLNYTASINPDLVRVSNSIAYMTPTFGGVRANLQHWRGNNPAGSATPDAGNGEGIRVHYDNGGLGVLAHYARNSLPTGDAEYKAVAGVYDFGTFRVTGNYMWADRAALSQKGGLVGLVWTMGVIDLKASIATFSANTAGNPKATKLAVGGVYNLSKRTALYASLAHINNKNGSALSIAGTATAANEGSSGFDLGVRHNF